jgi:hypothetical protein
MLMTNKQKVLAQYPNAYCYVGVQVHKFEDWKQGDKFYFIMTPGSGSEKILSEMHTTIRYGRRALVQKFFRNTSDAWRSAANQLQ